MIARTWRGWTAPADADPYFNYLCRTGLSAYSSTEGNLGALALRALRGGRAEFLLVSFWTGEEAVRRFAGPAVTEAVFYPEDERFLVRREREVTHYDLLRADVKRLGHFDPQL